MSELQYGHDLWGALGRGHARRCRTSIATALDSARGWSDPMDTTTDLTRGWRLALGELLTEARRRGVTEEQIARAVEREVSDDFGGGVGDRERRLRREPQPASENPSGDDWEAFDRYVDELRPDDAKTLLKEEARLRRNAQLEAAIR